MQTLTYSADTRENFVKKFNLMLESFKFCLSTADSIDIVVTV